jgi:hypothetical protein
MLSNRRTRFGIATMVLSAAVLAAGVAFADTKTIGDGRSTAGPLDIVSATHTHTSNGKLLHVIRTTNHIPRTSHSRFCLFLWLSRPTSTSNFDRFICWQGNNGGDTVAARTFNGTRVGAARVLFDTNETGVRFRTGIVHNHTYWWRVTSFRLTNSGPCAGPAGCFDQAPNGNRHVRHTISRGSFTG